MCGRTSEQSKSKDDRTESTEDASARTREHSENCTSSAEKTEQLSCSDGTEQSSKNYSSNDSQNTATTDQTSSTQHSNIVSYESLNAIEKDSLAERLRNDILQNMPEIETCCFSFVDWVCKQFRHDKAVGPASTPIYESLDKLEENCHTENLFANQGIAEKVELYRKSILLGDPVDCDEEDFDIYSLAIATMLAIKESIEFFDDPLYKRIAELYRAGESKDALVIKLPFTMKFRDIFVKIISLVNQMEASKDTNHIGRDGMVDLIHSYILSWKFENITDPLTEDNKKALFSDLLDAEFQYVPLDFYNKTR